MILIVLYSLLNAARGSGARIHKVALAAALGIVSYLHYVDYILSIIISLGFLMSFSKGWTHKAFHGWNDDKVKFKFISTIVDKIHGKQIVGNKIWGVTFMSLYALLMQYPQFIALSVAAHSNLPLLLGLGVLLNGVLQYIFGILFWERLGHKTLRAYEFFFGAYLGWLIFISVFYGG